MVFSIKYFWVLINRAKGDMKTICKNCGDKPETFKLIDDDGSHSYLCGCGCTIYRFHKADSNNQADFFLKTFIPAKEYKKDFKAKK